jgi:hypothetical protein
VRPKAAHHLVGDVDNAVAIADLAHSGEESLGWHHDARGARDRLQDDRGERRGTLKLNEVLQALERPVALFFLGGRVVHRAVQERTEEVHGAGRAVVVRPAPRVAGQIDGRGRAAVIAAIRRENLEAPGVQARHAHRVFDGLGTAVGEEDFGGALKE